MNSTPTEPRSSSRRQKSHSKEELAVLCGVVTREEARRLEMLSLHPLEELTRLAATAGAKVKGEVLQRRREPHPSTYLGKGKVLELGMILAASDGNLVISDDDLSPAQGRKLEKALETRVIDRSQLILDIFARHARSKQARLQVELAQLQYTLPRLKRMWTHLERLGGGIGTNGPGETQIETDRRIIRKKLSDTRRELEEIKARREREVAAREGFFTVSLVGYTNAGKSTLHRALTGSGVEVADRPFATLDTKTSLLDLPGGARVLISDTVGFIRKLPHHLIECFHATLEEARTADLLLHVLDASHPEAREQKLIVEQVLRELELDNRSTLLVLNKIDAVPEPMSLATLAGGREDVVRVSAQTGQGLDGLRLMIRQHHEAEFVFVRVGVPAGDGRTLARLESSGRVISREYAPDGTAEVVAHLSRAVLAQLSHEQPALTVSAEVEAS